MTIQDINCFLNLAETLNYTKTAEELFISQPAVTRHINALETELGFKLFDRSVKRKITLTDAGKSYYDGLIKCKKIYEDTLASINTKSAEKPLVINFMRGIRIPDAIVDSTAKYMSAHPNFHHFTNFVDATDFEKCLENGEVIVCQKDFAQKLKGYSTLPLTANPAPYYIVARDTHPAFKADHIDLQKIKDTTLFLPKNLPNALKEQYFSNLKETLGGMPVEIMYLDSIDSVELFLRSGRCFTIANAWSSLLDSKNHVSHKLEFASHYIAIWDNTKCLNPYVEDYLRYLKKLML